MSSSSKTTFIVLLIVAAVLSCPFLSCSAWFFYDGAVTYPEKQKMWQEYERIHQENIDPVEAGREWQSLAKSNGWPTEKPMPRTDEDIFTQYLLGSICSFISLILGLTALIFAILLWRDKKKQAITPNHLRGPCR